MRDREPQTVVPPEDALPAIRTHMGPLLVDFDETLYLQNSTEDYVGTAFPGPLAIIALRILDAIKPWRWSGGAPAKDVWRVWLISFLFPWTAMLWRRRAKVLGHTLINKRLAEALRDKGRPFTVVTLGFRRIVEPLLDAMGFGEMPLIACRDGTTADRVAGKLSLIRDALPEATIRSSMVVTDSPEDAPLLDVCAAPLLTQWPEARWRRALHQVYLPGQYLEFVKRPGIGAVKIVVIEDFPLWVLATLPLVLMTPYALLGLALLFASFWAIYERGYIENDDVAARLESDPQLSAAYKDFDPATVGARPWFYALGLGMFGVACLHHASGFNFFRFSAMWLTVLVGTRFVYRAYNFADKSSRIWLYMGLQLLRVCAFAAVAPINEPGALACAAMIVTRWQTYMTYRYARALGIKNWPTLPDRLIRFVLLIEFLIIGILASGAMAGSLTLRWSLVALLLVMWNGWTARKDLLATLRAARRLPPGPQDSEPMKI